MPKEFSRSQRVNEQIQRELAELIRLEVKDPRVGFITLTGVEVTPDYAHAKVYFTSMTGEADLEQILVGLRRAGGDFCGVSWASGCGYTPCRNCISAMTARSRKAAGCRN